ncbi:MAG TPA: gamma-glutamyltransferase [Myxococcales bacterium]|nr:gamma-glutamyltransferase [Myxococcales bacterium]
MLVALLLLAFPAVSPRGAVAAAHPLAAEAGASVMRRGGNAVDAAVAAAFALNVVEPQSSGIGGGGFALVYTARDRKVRVVDFREVGPAAARPDMYIQDGQPRQDLANAGPLSVAVPAAVKGYAELVKRFGKKPLAQITSPAEQIALRGFQVDLAFVQAAEGRLDCLAADPEAARVFLHKDGDEYEAPQPGDKLIQPDLARTLHAIGEKGPDAFYKGRVARAIVDSLSSRGGILTLADLARVQVRERQPLESSYRGYRVVSMPLPSSGGFIVAALLNVLEHENPRAGGYRPERFLHAMIETEKRLFAVRQSLGDPDFNPGVEQRVRAMAGRDFAGELWKQIGDAATPAAQVLPQREHGTTSVAAVDEEGNAIALTTTVNDGFGSCIVAKGAGFVLNDQMDDFAVAPGVANAYGLRGDAENAPGPGKVPLSSMAPTLVFAPDGAFMLALGSSGGSTIPTTVAQAIIHVVDDHMPIDRAIAQPRLHHNLFPDVVHVEADGLEAATAHALEARGHKLQFGSEPLQEHEHSFFASLWGKACGVQVDPDTGWRLGACDVRYDGGGAIP